MGRPGNDLGTYGLNWAWVKRGWADPGMAEVDLGMVWTSMRCRGPSLAHIGRWRTSLHSPWLERSLVSVSPDVWFIHISAISGILEAALLSMEEERREGELSAGYLYQYTEETVITGQCQGPRVAL